MSILDIDTLKENMTKKAAKWVTYLDSVQDEADKKKEMTRLLLETYLEGRFGKKPV